MGIPSRYIGRLEAGNIHLGTALNKTLKDFIVRYKNIAGFQSPYVPGWDTPVSYTHLDVYKRQIGDHAGICFCDISTGELYSTSLDKDLENEILNELGRCLLYTSRCV